MKDKTTITISRDTAKQLKITKIESDAKDMDQVVLDLIERAKNPSIVLNKEHIKIKNGNKKDIDWEALKSEVGQDGTST